MTNMKREKLSLIEVTLTSFPCPCTMNSTTVSGLGQAMSHASPCHCAADDMTIKCTVMADRQFSTLTSTLTYNF